MGYLSIWLFMAIVCAIIGSSKKIGAFDGFLLGLFLSVIGLIIVLCSKSLDDAKRDELLAKSFSQQNNVKQSTTSEELMRYKSLLDTGAITMEEYENQKRKLLS